MKLTEQAVGLGTKGRRVFVGPEQWEALLEAAFEYKQRHGTPKAFSAWRMLAHANNWKRFILEVERDR